MEKEELEMISEFEECFDPILEVIWDERTPLEKTRYIKRYRELVYALGVQDSLAVVEESKIGYGVFTEYQNTYNQALSDLKVSLQALIKNNE
jgi:hypothetical protein